MPAPRHRDAAFASGMTQINYFEGTMKDEKERKAILALRNYLQLLQNGNRVAGGRMAGLAALVRLCDASLGDFAAEAAPQQKPSRLISTRLMEEIERLERFLRRIRNAALAAGDSTLRDKTLRLSSDALREENPAAFTGWRDFSGGSQ